MGSNQDLMKWGGLINKGPEPAGAAFSCYNITRSPYQMCLLDLSFQFPKCKKQTSVFIDYPVYGILTAT